VNEVTFPSHALISAEVLAALQAAFRPRADGSLPFVVANASAFLKRAFQLTDVDEAAFTEPERCKETAQGRQCWEVDMTLWRKWVEGHIAEAVGKYTSWEFRELADHAKLAKLPPSPRGATAAQ